MTRVFISYSHDSDAHRAFVLELSDRLCRDGLHCHIDRYVNGFPPEGWPRWMEEQVEAADFVLMVCTPTYLNRYKGQETEGGRGVTFEGVVISQTLYDAWYRNNKFIPIIPEAGCLDHVPLPLKGYTTYRLPAEYTPLYRLLTDQPEAIRPSVGEVRTRLPVNAAPGATPRIHIDRLPTVIGEFFGREEQLSLLDAALAGNDSKIIQFVAASGTGKTKLLRHWLNQHDATLSARIVWSFYSQGASEDKQVSASPFFSAAFAVLGEHDPVFHSEEEKGERLADLLMQRRCLLVLDGLEPLQHAGRGLDGRLKDRALARLLQQLAARHSSLCIVTTRIEVHELRDRPHVQGVDLDNLGVPDGVALLRSLGVHGPGRELARAVSEVGGHDLALHLLGNALATYLDGDIHKRDTLDELIDDYADGSRHAFKVMQAYQRWLTDEHGQPTAELQLLYLLGLFDHPIETTVLEVLLQANIAGLTADLPPKAWQHALRTLREKHHLLSSHEGRPDLLDCHPLIREYFGGQLQARQPDAWRQAHETLYDYYRALPKKELPDTLEEMQPLFSAVAHGCAAGLQQRALEEVYWPRIKREGEHYLTRKLAAFSDDLACVAHFFTTPWCTPASGLADMWQAGVLNWAGFRLRALGRLEEAVEPLTAALSLYENKKDPKESAIAASNLSELQLTLGQVEAACRSGQRSVDYADQSADWGQFMVSRTTHADALHQAGGPAAALALFQAAEHLQKEHQPHYPRLYSLGGFRYCDLLLAQGDVAEVLERAEQTLVWAQKNRASLLDIALNQLTLGRAHLQKNDLLQAAQWLALAVDGLRKAGQQDYLPRGLLARATLHRRSGEFPRAHQDLQEVLDLAEPSGMRLFLTDYHLEAARLGLAESDPATARPHVEAAARLIEATGYHRRLPDLAELRAALGET